MYESIWEVVGFKYVKYVKKSTGENVEAYDIYLQKVEPEKDVQGIQCMSTFLKTKYSAYAASVPAIGDMVEDVYDRFGNLDLRRV